MADTIRPNRHRNETNNAKRNRLTGGGTEEAPLRLTNGGSMEPMSESNSDRMNEGKRRLPVGTMNENNSGRTLSEK